jgi:hypothetical protein
MEMFSWTVRFDVSSEWVADGFTLSDARAKDMLAEQLSAATDDEFAAVVLDAPPTQAVLDAQGYHTGHPLTKGARLELVNGLTENGVVRKAMTDAIALLDSVAFVREEGDETATVLANLRTALAALGADELMAAD